MRVRWGKRHYEQGKSRSRIVDLNSASMSMDVSDDKLFDNIKKRYKYHDFLKGNSKCCHYLVDFRLAKKQQIGEFRRNEFLVAHYFKLRGK